MPGSIIEQLKIIEPLTNPTAHGGSASDAFHVVIPSMPGYGFSSKPTSTGWGVDWNAKGVSIPVSVSVCPGEAYQAPLSWAERAYPKLIYYHQAEKGGHFAAWEQPTIFAQELRAAFKSLRSSR